MKRMITSFLILLLTATPVYADSKTWIKSEYTDWIEIKSGDKFNYFPNTVVFKNGEDNKYWIRVVPDEKISADSFRFTTERSSGVTNTNFHYHPQSGMILQANQTYDVEYLENEIQGISNRYRSYMSWDNNYGKLSGGVNIKFADGPNPPTILESRNPSSWTNKEVIVSPKASDDSGLAVIPYSFNGLDWSRSLSQTFTSNGKITIWAKDNEDLISSKEVIVNNIDKLKPNKPKWVVK